MDLVGGFDRWIWLVDLVGGWIWSVDLVGEDWVFGLV